MRMLASISIGLEAFAFDNGERLANVVDTGDSHPTKRYRSRAHRAPEVHAACPVSLRPSTQRFIDQLFQADTAAAAQSFERSSYIIVERQVVLIIKTYKF